MYFSPVGFAVGLALAQRNNLSQSAAAPVALVGGVAGATPIGLVLALVLAQRSAPTPAPAPAAAAIPAPPAAAIQPPPVHQMAHQFARSQLAIPGNIRVQGQRRANQRMLLSVEWDEVPQTRFYHVRCYRRIGHAWSDMPTENRLLDSHRAAEFLLPAGETDDVIRQSYGFTVSATEALNVVPNESDKTTPNI